MTKEQFINFLKENNLSVKIVPEGETTTEKLYKYEGYKDGKLVFDMNEFAISKNIKLDVEKSDPVELICLLKHAEWVHEMFID